MKMLRALSLGIATLSLTLSTGITNAQEKPFRIGVLNDQSGPHADQGGAGSALTGDSFDIVAVLPAAQAFESIEKSDCPLFKR